MVSSLLYYRYRSMPILYNVSNLTLVFFQVSEITNCSRTFLGLSNLMSLQAHGLSQIMLYL